MNSFDVEILTVVNQFSQQSRIVDNVLVLFAYNYLLKGGVLVALLWSLWFKNDALRSGNRQKIIALLLSCFAAIVLARILALTLPFRLRPIHEEFLSFLPPYGMTETVLEGWSAFPSDHAVLFFTLSTGLLFISKQIGLWALLYTALFIAFPRIYLGLHYPTDIIAGAIIGMAIALVGTISLGKIKRMQQIANWSHSKPHLFYPLFFLLTFQVACLFDGARAILHMCLRFVRVLFS